MALDGDSWEDREFLEKLVQFKDAAGLHVLRNEGQRIAGLLEVHWPQPQEVQANEDRVAVQLVAISRGRARRTAYLPEFTARNIRWQFDRGPPESSVWEYYNVLLVAEPADSDNSQHVRPSPLVLERRGIGRVWKEQWEAETAKGLIEVALC